MKKHFYTKLYTLVAILSFPLMVAAQDLHYTNFGFSPLNINPALTGVFPGDIRANGSYRQQWGNYRNLVSYTTFTGSADMKLGGVDKPFNPWRVGVLFNYDVAGWSRLQNAGFYLTGAYALPLSKSDYLSAGAGLGVNQRAFRTRDLTWDDQFSELLFNPNIVSQDVGVFDETIYFADLSGGVNYHHQKPGKRGAFDLGFGAFHLNRPKTTFRSGNRSSVDPRLSLAASTNIPVVKWLDVLLEGMGQWQGPHSELVLGLGGRLYFVDKPTKLVALQAGVSLRTNDAYSPHVGLLYNNWRVAFNFDANFSPFKTATNRLGGPELNVQYIFSRVRPGNYCALCPTTL